jgi:ADP-heptose:LPS heptosyltransferase
VFTTGKSKSNPRILVVRIGSMGDVIHALPACATLKHSFPGSTLTWVIHPRWAQLLEANPFVDDIIRLDRRKAGSLADAWRALRHSRYDFAVDFQGLIQSALVASVARPDRIFGFHQSQLREKLAALFYSSRVRSTAVHVVDRNLELAAAAGASTILLQFPLPAGIPEGDLPEGGFVLANASRLGRQAVAAGAFPRAGQPAAGGTGPPASAQWAARLARSAGVGGRRVGQYFGTARPDSRHAARFRRARLR